MFLRILIIVIVVLALIGCSIFWVKPKQAQNLKSIHTSTSSKKVVFLVVDSLMDQPLQKALQSEDVPALKFFMENGHYYPELISSYPTMSVTIDSTLLTGTYADQHKVPGLVWYNQAEGRVISYGSSVFENVKLGLSNFVHDSLYQLNNSDLSPNVETIYENLQKNGLSTASINGLMLAGIPSTPSIFHG
ncbi:hypothetical protein GCM10008967_39690 [Bacillus carboniphilus]|uniref:Alkaline phosphatase family protein n=1 Tax=Bacillus carboniphilus TaxID=86663 RepID=A0ABN0WS22_9BACI